MTQQLLSHFVLVLRGPESNRGLEVMSLPRYLSSTPLYILEKSVGKIYTKNGILANLHPEFCKDTAVTIDSIVCQTMRQDEVCTIMSDAIANLVRLPGIIKRIQLRRCHTL